MKQHTTNYTNTFIEIADDCPVEMSEILTSRSENKTIPQMQYEMMTAKPYAYTSVDHGFSCRHYLELCSIKLSYIFNYYQKESVKVFQMTIIRNM
jgi:hypothetical protein